MSFHEVSFGAYSHMVEREIDSIMDAIRLHLDGSMSVADAIGRKGLDAIGREAIDRLYIKGIFHDIMIRWPKKEF